jgi:hypothetical protein
MLWKIMLPNEAVRRPTVNLINYVHDVLALMYAITFSPIFLQSFLNITEASDMWHDELLSI